MRVYTSLEGIRFGEETVVALGNFDGVHSGHRHILATAVQEAKKRGCLAACYTFSNHPRVMLRESGDGNGGPEFLCTEEEKLALLEAAGMEVVFSVPFDRAVMTMEPGVFVKEILLERLHAVGVSCGFNYRYGRKASGDTSLLEKLGETLGFSCFVHEAVKFGDMVVSSTEIRAAIADGNMKLAAGLLGRPFSMCGLVVRGNRIGSGLGFPTANLMPETERIAPPHGVYFTKVQVDGRLFPALTNVGNRPTIGGAEVSVETHVFGLNQELYDKKICVAFLAWLRPEIRFASLEELRLQIAEDCAAAKAFHAQRGQAEAR